ncbi:hypothetical protein [Cryptosporangium sp. NPDC051539]|uniref:hypothetical protein n=1 Tax=Cryptosporangium sp. NPDC051539 TaxID=3363962 RepID=UPI0037A7BA61
MSDVFQLRTGYRGCRLSQDFRAPSRSVRAGDRAPDASLPTGRLFARRSEFVAVAFGDEAAVACTAVGVPFVPVGRGESAVRRIYDVDAGEEALFLIRPDGYVGLTTGGQFTERLAAYLAFEPLN